MLAQITITIDGEELTPELELAIENLESDVYDLLDTLELNYDVETDVESN